jgi:CubicO group peptidase (beta-lactamase class C family)
MRDDTGFLFGSIAKVLTTTLTLQQVERGFVDLDERVITSAIRMAGWWWRGACSK